MEKSYPIMDDKAEKKIREEANTGRQVIKNVFSPWYQDLLMVNTQKQAQP